MALISLQNINIAFGGPLILKDLNLQIEKNQRICLLGRNGAGKTTLMHIIAGTLVPDGGIVHRQTSLKVSCFAQSIPQDLSGPVFEIIARGLGKKGELLVCYHHEERRIAQTPEADHALLNRLHEELDAINGWTAREEIAKIITKMDIDSDWEFQNLSGGQKRRTLLAAALVAEPDLLLLDEPTNHLDIDTIAWLEEYLLRLRCTILFVTHDRMLLRKLATRIIELDRGELVDWACNYDTFLKRRQAVLEDEEKEWARFDRKLAEEEIWVRRGIKARRTRNEGRVRELLKMRAERSQRREREANVEFQVAEAQRSGRMVIEAKNITFGYGEQPVIRDFNTVVMRGDKTGVLGPNGCGKTTLVNLLLGNLAPQSGSIRHGTNLAITYFDQMREQLDEEKSVRENVLLYGDIITLDGQNRHILSYLQDFLFTPERARSPVKSLSGGERNRLLLARIFTRPANVMVFDEPTNDLDAETLELLEDLLVEFSGTVLVISHDRAFLNNVVTSTLVFAGNGLVKEYAGGYDDWLMQSRSQQILQPVNEAVKIDRKQQYKEEKKARQKRKLSFKETKELEALPAQIEALETEQRELYAKMADPDFVRIKENIVAAKARLAEVEQEIARAYERWEQLEAVGED